MNTQNRILSSSSSTSTSTTGTRTNLRASVLAMAAFLFFGALLGLPGRSAAQEVEESEETTEPAADPSQGVINIQTATAEQLQLLRGIGPSRAQAILESRERRPFRRVEDILRVRGVGRATFRRIRAQLTVEGPTTLTGAQR